MPKASKKTAIKTSYPQKTAKIGKIKWGESYVSLILGIIVVVVAFVLVFTIFRNQNYNLKTTSSVSIEEEKKLPKTYQVKAGDHLWVIAEKLYDSGYNWVDLAKANKLQNPDIIYTGTKLIVPDAKPIKIRTTNQVSQVNNVRSITTSSYTVKQGDYLWDIAIRAYGDGYQWIKIAKENKLVNPDLIFSGNVLKIPR